MMSVFRSKWGIRFVLFGGLVLVWFGLQAYRRFVYRDQFTPRPVTSLPSAAQSPEQMRAMWRQRVEGIIQGYEQGKDASRARDALLGLTVAREDQEVHLRLVLALNAIVEKAADAELKWQEAKKAFERP